MRKIANPELDADINERREIARMTQKNARLITTLIDEMLLVSLNETSEEAKKENMVDINDLMRDLKWLGLQWDEGPGCEGDCGPYFQSERLDIYHREIKKLLDAGCAYYCFCTEERLQEVRAEQEKSHVPVTGYDRHCRNISREEAEARIAAGEKAVIRFKVPETGVTEFDDMIRGHISYQNELLDDLVLIKRDGYPTYHFASVVDDHLMGPRAPRRRMDQLHAEARTLVQGLRLAAACMVSPAGDSRQERR